MMNTCAVEILTHTEGNLSRFTANGTFSEEENVCRISYRQEGDAVLLTVGDGFCTMERKGDVSLKMHFLPGERTEFILLGGGGEGKVPLSTHRYSVKRGTSGVSLTLGYDLHYPAQKQRFLLKTKITVISEEK